MEKVQHTLKHKFMVMSFSAAMTSLLFFACSEDVRTANIIANDPDGVKCLCLDRE